MPDVEIKVDGTTVYLQHFNGAASVFEYVADGSNVRYMFERLDVPIGPKDVKRFRSAYKWMLRKRYNRTLSEAARIVNGMPDQKVISLMRLKRIFDCIELEGRHGCTEEKGVPFP